MSHKLKTLITTNMKNKNSKIEEIKRACQDLENALIADYEASEIAEKIEIERKKTRKELQLARENLRGIINE